MGVARGNMRHEATSLSRFVRRVHLRLVLVRAAECAAIGTLCAAGISLLLLPLLVIRSRPALPVVLILLGVGALVGVAWMALRRPRVLDAAVEADRQLGLADLFATAWLTARDGGAHEDLFAQAVLAHAEFRAATLSPSSVVLNRFGARAWTGVGLAMALSITLALLAANPLVSQADSQQQGGRNTATARLPSNAAQFDGRPFAGASAMPIAPDFTDPEDGGFNPARNTNQVTGDATSSADASQTANPTGSGGGAGTSRSNPTASLPNTASTARDAATDGSRSSGGGATTSIQSSGRDASSSTSSGANTANPAPAPWATRAWPAARTIADNAVRSGVVPAQYHDLVRSYFDRAE